MARASAAPAYASSTRSAPMLVTLLAVTLVDRLGTGEARREREEVQADDRANHAVT